MSNSFSVIVRLIIITLVLIVATLLVLAVSGLLSSDILRDGVVKTVEIALIILAASGAVLLAAKK